jgi:hypothetical protein
VYLINPGFVQTPLTAKNNFAMPALQTPQAAAQAIRKGLNAGAFEIHFPRRFTLALKPAALAALSPALCPDDAFSGAHMTIATPLLEWYAALTPQTLAQAARYYAADARFRDPFNDVQGVAAITAIFEHMFATTEHPRFVITGCIVQEQQALRPGSSASPARPAL